jgi:Leucine-rich repeat (LRR) protein
MNEKEAYTEAQRLIKECREKNGEALDFFGWFYLSDILSDILELENFRILDLVDTNIKKIPVFLKNLSYLEELKVGSSYPTIDKREDTTLPPELGKLHNLRRLRLGYSIPEIPEWIWELDKLEYLTIHNDDIKTIPSGISNLKKLRSLEIIGENISVLPNEIGEIVSLADIYLICPQLSTLPEKLAYLKKMSYFSFNLCNLTAIPDFLYHWTELEYLLINMARTSQNSHTALKEISEKIGNLKKLKRLSLSNANIVKIPESLGGCSMLENLNLSGSFKTLPESIGGCKNLKSVSLSSCKLSELPESFCGLEKLEELCLNAFALKTLPGAFGNLSALKEISIHSNALSELPESFCRLKKLEKLNLVTFYLKALPDAFGNLRALKEIDIITGALTELPESMGSLRNLKSVRIDAYNVKKIPDSFKNLPNKKNIIIETGLSKPDLLWNKDSYKKRGAPCFSELVFLSWRYRRELLKTYSIKQIETLLCSAPNYYNASGNDKELFKQIIAERSRRLNRKFKWTNENIKRIVKISDEFLKAWEDGFVRAKMMIDTLYENERDKDSFNDKYDLEITLDPVFMYEDDENEDPAVQLYETIFSYLNPEWEFNMSIKYDPAAKNEEDFWGNIHISREQNWNILGLGDTELADQYICYALHILYDHYNWAFEDIMKINNISSEIKVFCFNEKF